MKKAWVVGVVSGGTCFVAGVALTYVVLNAAWDGKAPSAAPPSAVAPAPSSPKELDEARAVATEFMEGKRYPNWYDSSPWAAKNGFVITGANYDCKRWEFIGAELAPTRDEAIIWGTLDDATLDRDFPDASGTRPVFSMLIGHDPALGSWRVQAYIIARRGKSPWDPRKAWQADAKTEDGELRWVRRVGDTFLMYNGIAESGFLNFPSLAGAGPLAAADYHSPSSGLYDDWTVTSARMLEGGKEALVKGRADVVAKGSSSHADAGGGDSPFTLLLRKQPGDKWRVTACTFFDP